MVDTALPDNSPTAMILAYLRSKGLPPTSANVRQALQLNSTNPGVIAGLTNQAPPPPDAVGSTAQGPGPAPGPQAALPVPPIPPAGGPPPVAGPVAAAGGGGGGDSNIMMSLINAILGGGAATAAANIRPGAPGATPAPAPETAAPSATAIIPTQEQPQPQPQISGPATLEGEAIPPREITVRPKPPTQLHQTIDGVAEPSGMNWSKMLDELAPVLRSAHP